MLYKDRKQLAMDLCFLVQGDYEILNDIIIEYCELIDDKRFNDLEEYCAKEIRSIVWSCYHYYRVLRSLQNLTKPHHFMLLLIYVQFKTTTNV